MAGDCHVGNGGGSEAVDADKLLALVSKHSLVDGLAMLRVRLSFLVAVSTAEVGREVIALGSGARIRPWDERGPWPRVGLLGRCWG